MPTDNEMPEFVQAEVRISRAWVKTDQDRAVVWLADALDRAQRERDEVAVAVSARTYEACIAIAEKVASHTDDLMRGAVRTQSSGGAGHAIGYGSAAREDILAP